jgi:hypothetical protein
MRDKADEPSPANRIRIGDSSAGTITADLFDTEAHFAVRLPIDRSTDEWFSFDGRVPRKSFLHALDRAIAGHKESLSSPHFTLELGPMRGNQIEVNAEIATANGPLRYAIYLPFDHVGVVQT